MTRETVVRTCPLCHRPITYRAKCCRKCSYAIRRQRLLDRFAATLPERFQAKVGQGDGCWLWQGALMNKGYGVLKVGGRPALAHRIAWHLAHGAIPDGLQVLHKCDNPPCVRPDHLFLGTQADNVADMIAKGRKRTRQRVAA